jgi:CubicO group peptidase (beta-lactamase class C family)
LCSDDASAQAQSRQLVLNEPVRRQLVTGDRHAYSIRLDAGQFLFATVDHRGIDVYVSILDSSGEVVTTGEGPTGANGLEYVSFVPETSGWYWIALLPRVRGPEAGVYTITLERLEFTETDFEQRIDQIFAAWDRPGSPGAAVAVVQNGEVVQSRGYGLAQMEYEIPIEPSSVFHVASVSKQFTAFAVLMLAAEGRLSLDENIRVYLPELPDYGHTITIRHLLHHTSGLRDQWSLLAMAGWRMDDVITRDQILRLVVRQRELNFEPGTEYLYSNTGFTLLAEIVERVTGQLFRAWTEQHIFAPLGMENTHFHDDHRTIVPNRAYSYQSDPAGGFKKAVLSYANVGATSLFTTLDDLTKWAANFETGDIGGPDIVRRMRSRGVLNNGDTLDYAMGQAIGSYRGLLALYHAGADAGYRAYLLRFPLHRLSVVVMANLASIDAGRLARQVAELYLDNQIVAAIPSIDGAVTGIGATGVGDPTPINDYLGDYDIGGGATLVPISSDRYLVDGTQQYIQFSRDVSGTVFELRVEEPGSLLTARRVEAFDATAVRLEEYEGTFYAEELDATYRLEVKRDTLLASHLRLGSMTLVPLRRDYFVTNQWFIRGIRFDRDNSGQVTGFVASNARVRGLRFVRR